jgi:hypothetical protein
VCVHCGAVRGVRWLGVFDAATLGNQSISHASRQEKLNPESGQGKGR